MERLILTEEEYFSLSSLVYRHFGIVIKERNKHLLLERLQNTLRSGGFDSFTDYYHYIMADVTGQALLQLVDKISTNHTAFFREMDHFTFFASSILPSLCEKQRRTGKKELKIWSAGCSSGEEAYSLAMVIDDFLGNEKKYWDIGILATDISKTALYKAEKGVYNLDVISNVPNKFLRPYFIRKNNLVEISGQIKKSVIFRRFNLMNEVFPFKTRFHVIFCRNVMIYFDEGTKRRLVKRFFNQLETDGYFFIGYSEILDHSQKEYRYVKPAIYQKI